MMKTYARLENGVMVERIDPMTDVDGNEIPVEQRFHPDFVAQLVEIDPENPPPSHPPLPPAPDWRPEAWTELRSRRDRLLTVLSGMQSDYITLGNTYAASLCLSAKQGLKDITEWPAVTAVVGDPQGTREQFNSAVVARWTEIADPAPAEVKAEFYRYGTEP